MAALLCLFFLFPSYAEGTAGARPYQAVPGPGTVQNYSGEILSGGCVYFLKNMKTDQQQLSCVIKSPEGKVIVIDGGTEDDADHLYGLLSELGGTVDAWFLTHPHTDHAGGLYAILRDHPETDIRGIYYHFHEYDWYAAEDPEEVGMLWHLTEVFQKLPADRLHSGIGKNEIINISENLSVRVMNDPLRLSGPRAVNNSGLAYDISLSGTHFVILGDLGEEAGELLLGADGLAGIVCDFVQTAHHGQDGVGEAFYRALSPLNVVWDTNENIYSRRNSKYRTDETKQWFSGIGVRNQYTTVYGDVIIR